MTAVKLWRWTLLFVNDQGDILHIKWFKSLAILTLFLLIFSLSASTYFYFLFINSTQESEELQKLLDSSEYQISELRKEKMTLLKSLLIAKSMNNTSSDHTKNKDLKETGSYSKKTEGKPRDPEKKTGAFENAGIQKTVKIEDLDFSRDSENSSFKLKFKLKNISPIPGPASGYIFMILKTHENNPDKWLVFPDTTKLTRGMPSNIKNGRYFSIKHFKNIIFDIPGNKDLKQIKTATLLVYEQTGKLLLEKNEPFNLSEVKKQ